MSINVASAPKTSTFQARITKDGDKVLREQAIALLMAELKAGEDSAKSESDWISEEDMLAEFGLNT